MNFCTRENREITDTSLLCTQMRSLKHDYVLGYRWGRLTERSRRNPYCGSLDVCLIELHVIRNKIQVRYIWNEDNYSKCNTY